MTLSRKRAVKFGKDRGQFLGFRGGRFKRTAAVAAASRKLDGLCVLHLEAAGNGATDGRTLKLQISCPVLTPLHRYPGVKGQKGSAPPQYF